MSYVERVSKELAGSCCMQYSILLASANVLKVRLQLPIVIIVCNILIVRAAHKSKRTFYDQSFYYPNPKNQL